MKGEYPERIGQAECQVCVCTAIVSSCTLWLQPCSSHILSELDEVYDHFSLSVNLNSYISICREHFKLFVDTFDDQITQ